MSNSFIKKFLLSNTFLNIFLGLSLVLIPNLTFAQIDLGTGPTLESELSIEVIPTYPKPNETVFIQLEMYTEDLDKAEITWNQDNKIFVKENGKKSYSFKAPQSGKETTIEVRVKLQSGKTFYKKFTIKPTTVDLLWQSDSYVPAFYKGKALHPKQGNLRIVAIPDFRDANGKVIAAEKLIYKWSDGNNVYDTQSGYGKNVLNIESSILGRGNRVEVLVTSPTDSSVAREVLDIPTTNPEILFYEVSPLYGPMFNKVIQGSLNLKSGEVEILAAPFYASGVNNNTAKLNWRLNNQSSSDLQNSRTVVFRKPEGGSGVSSIQLQIENPSKILQSAKAAFNINFQE